MFIDVTEEQDHQLGNNIKFLRKVPAKDGCDL